MDAPSDGDPRVYMAAERTFLAWIRTGLALMGFGFVVARFGVFLHEMAGLQAGVAPRSSAPSLAMGLALIGLGVVVNAAAALRHRRTVEAIDRGHFRSGFGSAFGITVAGLLAFLGIAMAVYLAQL